MVSSVDRAYQALRAMAVDYRLKPGAKINESELAQQLEVSRTPLREALNRLSSEGFLVRDGGRGFRCRAFNAKQVFDLYEFRCELEVAAAALCCARAEDATLASFEALCETDAEVLASLPAAELIDRDEAFHEAIMHACGNDEMLRALRNLSSQIRFVRGIEREHRHARSEREHLEIARALMERDAGAAGSLLRAHIARRQDEIVEVIRRGYSRIYMAEAMQGLDMK